MAANYGERCTLKCDVSFPVPGSHRPSSGPRLDNVTRQRSLLRIVKETSESSEDFFRGSLQLFV